MLMLELCKSHPCLLTGSLQSPPSFLRRKLRQEEEEEWAFYLFTSCLLPVSISGLPAMIYCRTFQLKYLKPVFAFSSSICRKSFIILPCAQRSTCTGWLVPQRCSNPSSMDPFLQVQTHCMVKQQPSLNNLNQALKGLSSMLYSLTVSVFPLYSPALRIKALLGSCYLCTGLAIPTHYLQLPT